MELNCNFTSFNDIIATDFGLVGDCLAGINQIEEQTRKTRSRKLAFVAGTNFNQNMIIYDTRRKIDNTLGLF